MSEPVPTFSELDLVAPLVKAVTELGYESPLPIQAACIPPLLEGRDVLGLAQTGTGKTAAFALPLMSNLDPKLRLPQVLVLTPTRELALQVAEAFQKYARHMKGFHVLPIYGGQSYGFQFNQLNKGPHVVVGTPGRIQDHIDRGTLDLSGIACIVLDEADEMLRMGFVDEVEAIISKAPEDRQMALFSATMPAQIKRISKRYMNDPVDIRIKAKTTTAENIEQVYLVVPNAAKFEALARILETESYDGIIIFARTRVGTTELTERLAARGFDVAALNGEMTQQARERTVKRLKNGNVDIVVATDVAARGLDVDRISLVINYDIPGDSEAYIHRIGRTGRVGRYGKAILFANPRERRLLQSIERATRQPLKPMDMPTHDTVTRKRVEKFRESLVEVMAKQPLDFFKDLSYELMEEMNVDLQTLASGLLCYAQKDRPLQAERGRDFRSPSWNEPKPKERGQGPSRGAARGQQAGNMTLYRLEVGSRDGVEVRNIVGAIANETGLRSRFIGQILIHSDHSTVDMPDDLPQGMLDHLKKTYVGGKPLNISRVRSGGPAEGQGPRGGVARRGDGSPLGKPARKPDSKPKPKPKPKSSPALTPESVLEMGLEPTTKPKPAPKPKKKPKAKPKPKAKKAAGDKPGNFPKKKKKPKKPKG